MGSPSTTLPGIPGVTRSNFDLAQVEGTQGPHVADAPPPAGPPAATSTAGTDSTEAARPRAPRAPLYGSATDPRRSLSSPLGAAAMARANTPRTARNPGSDSWVQHNQYNRANSVFTAADRQAMGAFMTPNANESTVAYLVERTRAVGPQWITEAVGNYLPYQNARAGGGEGPRSTYSAIETLRNGGVCRDQMELITEVLRRAGYEAHTVAIRTENHAFTVYRDRDGRWSTAEYGYDNKLQTRTALEALQRVSPSALSFDLYQDGGGERASVVSRIYTESGLRMYDALVGADNPHGPGETGVTAGTDGVIGSIGVGSRTSLFVNRLTSGPDALLVGVSHAMGDNFVLTAAGGQWTVPDRSIGSRRFSEDTSTIGTIGARGAGGIFDAPIADGLNFRSTWDARMSAGVALTGGKVDSARTSALMDFRANANAELAYDVNPNLQVHGGVTAGVGTATMTYVATGGRNIGELPTNRSANVGVRYTTNRLYADATFRTPIGGLQADSLNAQPVVDVRGGYNADRWSVLAGARVAVGDSTNPLIGDTRDSTAYAAGRYRLSDTISVGAEAYMGTQLGERTSGARATLSVSTNAIGNALGRIF